MLPALRERRSDVPLLVSHFLEEFAQKNRKPLMAVAPEALELMVNHGWPGNVRELRNLIERIVVLKDDDCLRPEDLPPKMGRRPEPPPPGPAADAVGEASVAFQTAVSEFEKDLIRRALEQTNWVKNRAAELLKIKRTTLVEKIKRYNLERPGGDS
jgi:DNA-binding NtrC family response regulator